MTKEIFTILRREGVSIPDTKQIEVLEPFMKRNFNRMVDERKTRRIDAMKKSLLGNLYSPYANANRKNIFDYYEAFLLDSDRYLEQDGRIYSKIIFRCEYYRYEKPTWIVTVEAKKTICVEDILIDEHGREFVVKGFPMIRYGTPIPENRWKISDIVIQGKDCSIGEYLAKKQY